MTYAQNVLNNLGGTMDKFLWNKNSGRQMLAVYKDRLSFLRRMDKLKPIVSSNAKDVATDLDELTEARKPLVKGDRRQKRD
jgi:signal transduction histidine kinase